MSGFFSCTLKLLQLSTELQHFRFQVHSYLLELLLACQKLKVKLTKDILHEIELERN